MIHFPYRFFPDISTAKAERGRANAAKGSQLVEAIFFFTFLDISNIIERTMESYSGGAPSSLEEAIELIRTGERIAQEVCDHGG